jgi:hypothetical protein
MGTQQQMRIASNQQCVVSSLYRIWVAYAVGLAGSALIRNWTALLVWAAVVPLAKWAQIRFYPRLSPLFGYGSVKDEHAPALAPVPAQVVTFYHALACPFCPIVLERLRALQSELGFTLNSVDVTLHPQFLADRGIRSVPVVEKSGRLLVGNATSKQLAELIAG